MPEIITTPDGGKLTTYSVAERQAYMQFLGKGLNWFVESPAYVMALLGWDEPRYAQNNPFAGGEAVWEREYVPSTPVEIPTLFYEIFTDGLGRLNGDEVRKAELRAGVSIDDSTAVRSYNAKLDQDMALYLGPLTLDDVVDQIALDEGERMYQVHGWVSKMLDADPVYFGFRSDKYLSEDVQIVDGIRYVTPKDHAKIPTVGIALMGRKGRKRDVFSLAEFLGGSPSLAAAGKRAMDLPGRDRAYRVLGTHALSTYLAAPHLVLSSLQVSQAEEGRPILMERSAAVPGWVWSWK